MGYVKSTRQTHNLYRSRFYHVLRFGIKNIAECIITATHWPFFDDFWYWCRNVSMAAEH